MTGKADETPVKRIVDPARRRATRHWRIVTLVYLAALTTGTHWPELRVGVGPGPPPDKVLHLLAFGGLTLLVWQCRLFKRIWQAGLACALWVLVDEWTQSLAILNRQSSWQDVIAGELGVICGVVWNTATMPTGPRPARWRRKMFDRVVQQRLATWRGWIALGGGASVIGVASATLSVLFALASSRLGMPEPSLQIAALIAFSLAFVFGVFVVFDQWWERDARDVDKVCFECGRDCNRVDFSRSGWGLCMHCGTTVHAGQWIVAPRLRIRAQVEGLIAGATMTFMTGLITLSWALAMLAGPRALDSSPSTTHPLYSVALLTAILIASSFGISVARAVMVKRLALYEPTCANCGYDLRFISSGTAMVRCPECGSEFARVSPVPVAGDDA